MLNKLCQLSYQEKNFPCKYLFYMYLYYFLLYNKTPLHVLHHNSAISCTKLECYTSITIYATRPFRWDYAELCSFICLGATRQNLSFLQYFWSPTCRFWSWELFKKRFANSHQYFQILHAFPSRMRPRTKKSDGKIIFYAYFLQLHQKRWWWWIWDLIPPSFLGVCFWMKQARTMKMASLKSPLSVDYEPYMIFLNPLQTD